MVYKAVDACKNVLRGLHDNKIAQRELDRIGTIVLLSLGSSYTEQYIDYGIQDITCIKELNLLYEAATIEDVYLAYEHLRVDEGSMFSCVGIAGAQAGEDISEQSGYTGGVTVRGTTFNNVPQKSRHGRLNKWLFGEYNDYEMPFFFPVEHVALPALSIVLLSMFIFLDV
ncbi:hypothetical protein ACLOJK_019770 [Asimina triloba]